MALADAMHEFTPRATAAMHWHLLLLLMMCLEACLLGEATNSPWQQPSPGRQLTQCHPPQLQLGAPFV